MANNHLNNQSSDVISFVAPSVPSGGIFELPPTYLILTPEKYFDTILRLANYRSSDYNIVIKVTDGLSKEQIQFIILSELNLLYVLIVGNINDVPSFLVNYTETSTYFTDHPYSLLTREDNFPDIALGRLIINNNDELNNIIDKIIDFETTNYFRNDRLMLVASAEDEPPPIQGWQTATQYENLVVSKYSDWTITKVYCQSIYDENEGIDTAEIFNLINNNQKLISFKGHGNRCFGIDCPTKGDDLCVDDAKLRFDNPNMYPILLFLSCKMIQMRGIDTFTNVAMTLQNRGAVALFGSSSTTGVPNTMMKSLFSRLHDIRTLGIAIVVSKREWGFNGVYSWHYQLIGDPALRIN